MIDLAPEQSLNFDRVVGEGRRRDQLANRKNRRHRFFNPQSPVKEPTAKTAPRPDWMDDPSLLPKRPPGAR